MGQNTIVQDNLMQIIPNIVNKYWDYSKNKVKPEKVSIFSKELFYWKNDTDISFHLSPLGIEKPLTSTSKKEREIYYFIKSIFKDAQARYKILGVEVDIYIPSLKIAIEYDGYYFHKNNQEMDLEKNTFLSEQKIKLIRIREDHLPSLNDKKCIEISYFTSTEKVFLILIKEIKKIIKNRKLSLSTEEKEILTNFNINKIDMSENKIKSTYLLQADDPNKNSNERIINYYKLHKGEFNNIEVWNNFLILVYSRPCMQLFENIKDEYLVEKFYTHPDQKGMVVDRIIDIYATNNLKLIEQKCKELINCGSGNWFFAVLKRALEKPNLLREQKEKYNLLLELIKYFRKILPNYYLTYELDELELKIKNI